MITKSTRRESGRGRPQSFAAQKFDKLSRGTLYSAPRRVFRLPGGIFNRSFVKAYARHVGFDEKEAVEGYLRVAREHGESPDEVTTTPYQSHVFTDGDRTRSLLVTLLLTILILGVLVLGVYAGRHWWQRQIGRAHV